ncbi:MAG: hypothetical protein A2051_02040 [Desulfovibrionales bacterium GWA2_65_9]|nr:MAG: hypothetical protein A2051_02040 [Desulfovibrionales bacterium GWA2_65_9]
MSIATSARRLSGLYALLFVLFVLFVPSQALSAPLPQPVEQSLGALLDLSLKRNAEVNPQSFQSLLEYVSQAKGDARDLIPARRYDANGTVLRVTMKTSLPRLMRYCYNPAIPSYLLFPSVLRLGGWYRGSDIVDRDPKPWLHLGKLDKPVALWGTEYEVNAPDSFGGGYYRYDLNRLIILTKVGGKNVLISVSKQKDKSSVGKKAVILDDGEWSYFYSGINGLNKGMIGWADTYMYDSASVQVFVEDGPNQTSFMLFKWLRAGWMGQNFVQKDHINEGSTRYANAFKKIVESDRLPDPDELASRVRELTTMSDADLEHKIAAYSVAIENIAKKSPAMDKSEFQKVVEGGKYSRTMNREERLSAILVEYLKSRLGKIPLVDFPGLPGARPKAG